MYDWPWITSENQYSPVRCRAACSAAARTARLPRSTGAACEPPEPGGAAPGPAAEIATAAAAPTATSASPPLTGHPNRTRRARGVRSSPNMRARASDVSRIVGGAGSP